MKVAIMQPYLFPYIGYWQLIHAVDVFVIYDDVNYINRGWINRNYFLEQGNKKLFTLETSGTSQNKLINQISVGRNTEKLIKTLHQNYSKAPYFKTSIALLTELLMNDEQNLARFITSTIQKICSFLGIGTQLMVSSEMFQNQELKSSDRIIDICKQLKASSYINPIGGIELYKKDEFSKQGIALYFIHTNPITYEQFDNIFIPNLSIIDLLMFNSIEKIWGFLETYELIKPTLK